MKNSNRLSFIIILFLSQNIFAQINMEGSIDGWFKMGSKPEFYDIGINDETYNDKPAYFIKSNAIVYNGFGTIAKSVKPDDYFGKRVKLSGYIRTINNSGWTGMWMRVDGDQVDRSLQFDNMGNRPIKGTTDWQKYEIVLDVPVNSRAMYYGVLVAGDGEAKFSDVNLEVVGNDVPSTNMEITYTDNNNYSSLPEKLKGIPDGIIVKHSPDIVFAEKTGTDTTTMYAWNFATTLKSIGRDLEIVEFGAYTMYNGQWVLTTITGKPFTNKDFREWYNCKKGKLKSGKEYSDKSNWYSNPLLQESKALWYYIGMSKEGELYKGASLIEYMPEVKK